ncbi:MAG: Flp family type IVb pilin [Planctomycetes bacterium]|nr:Flp family type IVb pilin [Planctomycetota bacterium]
MRAHADVLARFIRSEDGPTAVEYAVMLALIVIVCLTAIEAIGTNANTTFDNISKSLKK